MTTHVIFPIAHGTKVTLECFHGYEQVSGDDIVTCVGGSNFQSTSSLLKCSLPGLFKFQVLTFSKNVDFMCNEINGEKQQL